MINNYTPSVNILIQDIDLSGYFITSNVQGVFDAISANYKSGVRSINIIGAYGTGKSSFLSALSQHLTKEKVFFQSGTFSAYKSFHLLKMVGSYESFLGSFASLLGVQSEKPVEILNEFITLVRQKAVSGQAVLLLVDEFGKYLEFAAKNLPEKELYFLQELAEFVNNSGEEVLWVSTLHQDFGGYGEGLTRIQKNEWSKIKGRFKEISFNEPVEQLLFLASQRLGGEIPSGKKESFEHIFGVIEKAKVFPLRDFFNEEIAARLYPMDILSAAIVCLSLQQYGQNERSLFSFLNGDGAFDLKEFDAERNGFYSTSDVYDFLNYNLNSFLLSKANPHYTKWAEIRNGLERIEGEFNYKIQPVYKIIIKTIGLFQIFLPGNVKVTKNFLAEYLGANGDNSEEYANAILELEKRHIIRFYQRTQRFSLYEASDVDIDLAINEAAAEVSLANDVVKYLNAYFTFPTMTAKRVYFNVGTPRVFQFKITDNPYVSSIPEGEIDGYVNLVFNPYLQEKDLLAVSKETDEAILFGWYKNSAEIKGLIEEIEKAEIAREKHREDRIAKRELDSIIESQKNLLNHYVLHSFYNPEVVSWFYNGKSVPHVRNNRVFNGLLSEICEKVYSDTPVFKSEIVNKTRLSTAASLARKDLFKALIDHMEVEDIALHGFPPQKSIYYSLLKETGIHRIGEYGWGIFEIEDSKDEIFHFSQLLSLCNTFMDSSKGAKRSVSELYQLLSKRPFKLKRGFLDFWIPIYLLMKRGDYALYGEHGFITEMDGEVLELLVKRPKDYALKAYDSSGIRIDLFNQYRTLLSLEPASKTSSESFVQTVVPYIKFYKGLHPYAKNTRRITPESQKIRKAITEATDPEVLFFSDFPSALGYDIIQLSKDPELLKNFADDLQSAMREMRSCFDELLNRFESLILSLWKQDLSFSEYKEKLRGRFHLGLKQYLMLPYQKTFYDRLCSPLDHRNAWLSSLSQALVGKTLENVSDLEEKQLHDKFIRLVHELDNLNDIAKKKVDLTTEDVFKVEFASPGLETSSQVVRLPKDREEEFLVMESKVSELLSEQHQFNKIAILAEMLRKELEKYGK